MSSSSVEPNDKASKSVFLSHSSKDKDFVRKLAKDLTNNGIRVWLDETRLRAGDSLVATIERGLSESDVLLLVLSPDALDSAWVRGEFESKLVDEFSEQQLRVIPLLLKDCEIPPLLRGKLYIDFRSDYQKGLRLLLGALSGSIDKALYEDPSPEREFVTRLAQKSFISAAFNVLLYAVIFAGVSTSLGKEPFTRHQGYALAMMQEFLSTTSRLCGMVAIILFIISILATLKVSRSKNHVFAVDLFRSSVTPPQPISPEMRAKTEMDQILEKVMIITEKISASKSDEKVVDVPDVAEVNIFFSVWNNNPFAIKIFEISSRIQHQQKTAFAMGGPRELVIIDQDKSVADPTNTYEIPPGESCSFNLAYRVARTHHQWIAFALLLKFHEPTGKIKEVKSDALYFFMGPEKVFYIRQGEERSYADSDEFVTEAIRFYFG